MTRHNARLAKLEADSMNHDITFLWLDGDDRAEDDRRKRAALKAAGPGGRVVAFQWVESDKVRYDQT